MPTVGSSPRLATGVALPEATAAALRAGLPSVSERTITAVVAEVPEYAEPFRGDRGGELTRAVELALATFLRLAENQPEDDPNIRLRPAQEAAYALGRGEARSGRSMSALLTAYRVAAHASWGQWGALAIEFGLPPESLVPFASLAFTYIDQLSAASVSGHSDQLSTSGRVREQYLERLAVALLGGEPVEELTRRAQGADWPVPSTLTCLIGGSA